MKRKEKNERCEVRIGESSDGYIARVAFYRGNDLVQIYDSPYDAVQGITVMMRNRMGYATDKVPKSIVSMLTPVKKEAVESILPRWEEHLKQVRYNMVSGLPVVKDVGKYQLRKGVSL